jgi:hypothetical protein
MSKSVAGVTGASRGLGQATDPSVRMLGGEISDQHYKLSGNLDLANTAQCPYGANDSA